MSIAPLPRWDITPIEIALDLEPPLLANTSSLSFSGRAEPRICLVAAFALTPQLKRIIAALERVLPAHLPAGLRIAPAKSRLSASLPGAIAVAPMLPLLRLQRKFVAAIGPGLASCARDLWESFTPQMEAASARFIGNFVVDKAVPLFEPSQARSNFPQTRVRAIGITVYRLGRRGMPESMLTHWAYGTGTRNSIPL